MDRRVMQLAFISPKKSIGSVKGSPKLFVLLSMWTADYTVELRGRDKRNKGKREAVHCGMFKQHGLIGFRKGQVSKRIVWSISVNHRLNEE